MRHFNTFLERPNRSRANRSPGAARKSPQTTIEAIIHSVRERGVAALKESANIARLLACDDEAKTEINERIARLIAAKEIAA
jgi:hypothetical protein